MFLITTADQRFWKTDEPVLFLGEWCKLYSQKALWQHMQQETLPYHWDDRIKFRHDCVYLENLYERVLARLTQRLNDIHGETHGVRYWRILIGPWLSYFIHIFYDRYSCIELVRKENRVTKTKSGSYDCSTWLPSDYVEFEGWSLTDSYNQFLYDWIIQRMLKIDVEIISISKVDSQQENKKLSFWKEALKKGIRFYEKNFPYRLNEITILSSYLSRMDQVCLQLSLGQWPSCFFPSINQPLVNVDWTVREQIILSGIKDEFEQLLSDILKQQIPVLYLEGYKSMRSNVAHQIQSRPNVILTANDFHGNEGFKFWSAECVEKGARFAGVQHGGHYGNGLCNTMEDHEVKISDKYYTWGWSSPNTKNIQPLSAAKLNSCRNLRSDPKGRITVVLVTMPRYSYHLYSSCISATGNLAYLQDQYAFVRFLSKEPRDLLSIRFHQIDYQWSYQERWREQFPDLEFDLSREPFSKRLQESRLIVGTYNATTYLESFVANCPTVLFWNPHHWEIRQSEQSYFDELKQVGILHDTPESAARKINEIYKDPLAWWQGEEVQKAKNNFCHRFAKTSDDWIWQWRRELRGLSCAKVPESNG